ncbi:hypothetical protein BCR37DRAFT_383515, partial [Protomyces lactucae-debilis]
MARVPFARKIGPYFVKPWHLNKILHRQTRHNVPCNCYDEAQGRHHRSRPEWSRCSPRKTSFPSAKLIHQALRQEGCFNLRVYERRSHCGGVWIHDPQPARRKPSKIPATDPTHVDAPTCDGWPSPMYNALVTNIPARLMAYGDRPFPEQTPMYPTRQTVLSYLEDFAKQHDLMRDIQFDTQVLSLKKSGHGWRLATQHAGEIKEETFDRVIVASGHYETPLLPDIEGIVAFDKKYPEAIGHSKYYRSPESFAGLKVVVIGNGPSGIDIVSQLAQAPGAQLPILRSIRSPSKIPAGAVQVQDVAEIASFNAEDCSLFLKDGSRITNVDRVLFCTGYLYAFPFLDPRLGIVTDGLRLRNLYKQIFYQDDPSLAFLGMEMSIVPFPYSEAQACYIARIWSDRLTLPPLSEMQADEASRVAVKGDGRAFMVRAHPEDGEYIDELRELCAEATPVIEGALMPVQWTGERFALRAQGPALRRAWLDGKV